jgi:hypothetical protein
MATFTSFLNILPDPNTAIGVAGQALTTGSGGLAGPGFASVNFNSMSPVQVSTTNSGRTITRGIAGHKFSIKIKKKKIKKIFKITLVWQFSLGIKENVDRWVWKSVSSY